ncbi:MAG TPA: LuxR C-terminal-related transcriptional regulator [Mycobacterium sp.]|uniref:helix-turn-helix transcriptional regulator n=1 Tax=Mycobacterium sp. TaxID=1785 RepID=UPI002D37B7B0|nr:LuxR C-terminal-related transcriptional regulator [Mycobacterium sp.]HXY63390.1 LuxR C-terminal-related transcriptional regulator [Mycobacterium sp.]
METGSGSAWPLVGRDDEVRQALASLDDASEFQGVLLVGDSGIGKSTLARALADTVKSRGLTVQFVLGTETSKAVPLGAFYWLTTLHVVREPAVMLAAAQKTMEQERTLVVVDDAHLLDPLSATLVYQLATGGSTRLIVTIRSPSAVPDAVTALWKERLLLRLRINAFTRQQTEELAHTVLGDAVETRLINELHGRTAGNPLMLRGLLSAGRGSGVLVRSKHGWRLRGALHADRELCDLLEVRLQSLAAEELEAVEVLAAAEVLDWETLRGLCDADALAHLERDGTIQLVVDESHTVARLAHPIVGEVALKRAGVVRSRQLNGMLAQHLRKKMQTQEQRSRVPDVRTRILLAQLMMRSDLAPDLDVIIEAAASAVAMSNVALGEELARFAFDHGGGLPAALVLAEALRWQGRRDEAEAVLAGVDLDGADEWLTVRWGCLRAANLFFGCGQVERARLLLTDMRDRVDCQEVAGLVRAMEGALACFSGDVSTAIELGLPLCASDQQPLTMTWAVTSTSWALALVGRLGEVHQIANAGGAAVLGQMGPQRFLIGIAEAMAATVAGDFAAAERVWERYGPTITVGPEADAFVHAISGLVQLARGALPSACAAFRDSLSVMSHGFPTGVMLVAAWCAQAEGARGEGEAAAAALRSAEKAYGPQVAVFLPELELARAWERASVGQTTAARMHAVRAARIARQSGMYAVEMRALHTAVRFGDQSCAARLEELARTLNTPLAEAIATQARGLARQDGDLLNAAVDRFADLGALAFAADAAAQAADEHARKGHRGKEVKSSTRAYWLASQCGLRTPAVESAARPLSFSGREREIAMLVAAGLSDRQIADRLVVSVRTVGGHLYRVFAKLGINNRDQLIHLLGLERTGT